MTKEQLNEVLKQHKLWLNTKGEEGERVVLEDANLEGIDFSGSDLRVADLKGANLRYSDLTNVNLEGANLEYTDLRNAYLTSADLTGARLKGACLDDICWNMAKLNNTGVYLFKSPRHDGIYNSKDDKLYMFRMTHSLDYWLQNYADIGKKHRYTDEEIEEYGQWIKSLKELKSGDKS